MFSAQKKSDSLFLLVILFIAALLRLWNYGELPFMHDEFSALFRTQFNSYSELLEKAIRPDAHPAGVQSFLYYWVSIVGFSEVWVKLPFSLMGVASVGLIYCIGKRWFNATTGLFAASLLAMSQYTIFYSQLARPYEPGLFFGLLAVYFWTRIVFDEKPKTLDYVWFVLAAVATAYVHAFSLLLLMIQALTGFVFVRGKHLRTYLVALIAVTILYLPYLPVFFDQMTYGGVGGWLGEPDVSFFLDFLSYLFHYSWIYGLAAAFVLMFITIVTSSVKQSLNKFRIIALVWFILIAAIAYLYSVYRTPILQFSTLYFVFPFLVLFLFSFTKDLPVSWKASLLSILMLAGIYSLITERQHYQIMYQQGYDQIAFHVKQDMALYGDKNVAIVWHTPNAEMIEHYVDKIGVEVSSLVIEDDKNHQALEEYLKTQDADVLIYAWTDYRDLSYLAYFKSMFPLQVKHEGFFNAAYYVMAKEITVMEDKDKSLISDYILQSIGGESNDYAYESNLPAYSPSLTLAMGDLSLHENDVLQLSASFHLVGQPDKSILVLSITDTLNNSLFWQGKSLGSLLDKGSSDGTVFLSRRSAVFKDMPKEATLKAYIWKQDSSYLGVKKMTLSTSRQHPYHMGIFTKIVEND